MAISPICALTCPSPACQQIARSFISLPGFSCQIIVNLVSAKRQHAKMTASHLLINAMGCPTNQRRTRTKSHAHLAQLIAWAIHHDFPTPKIAWRAMSQRAHRSAYFVLLRTFRFTPLGLALLTLSASSPSATNAILTDLWKGGESPLGHVGFPPSASLSAFNHP